MTPQIMTDKPETVKVELTPAEWEQVLTALQSESERLCQLANELRAGFPEVSAVWDKQIGQLDQIEGLISEAVGS